MPSRELLENGLQQLDALLARRTGIGFEGPAGCGHGLVDVGGGAETDTAVHFFGGRIDNVERARLDRVDPLAIDVELELFEHRLSSSAGRE